MRKSRSALLYLSLIVAILLGGIAAYDIYQANAQLAARPSLDAPPTGGDFTLQSAQGPVSLHDFKGKLVMLYFGYTYCPDICPTNLGNLAAAWRRLPKQAQDKVQILFVSVDPQRDTLPKLKEYADYFQARIIGLTGSPETLADVARRYGVVYRKAIVENSAVGYLVDHSAFTYVIGPDGKLLSQLPHGATPTVFRQSMLNFLRLYQDQKETTP